MLGTNFMYPLIPYHSLNRSYLFGGLIAQRSNTSQYRQSVIQRNARRWSLLDNGVFHATHAKIFTIQGACCYMLYVAPSWSFLQERRVGHESITYLNFLYCSGV